MIRLLFLLMLLVFFNSCSDQKNTGLFQEEKSTIKLNVPAKGSLAQLQADTFKLYVKENALVHGYADQISVDVVVTILAPDDKKLGEFDNPARGPEPFEFKTPVEGAYKIVIAPYQKKQGDYSLVVKNIEKLASTPEKQVDQFVNTKLNRDEITPGVSVAVVKNGKIIYRKGYGYANLEYEIPNTPQTIFHIASVSKQVTAFAIAMLADQGKLSLDDDIRKHLPEMHDFGTPITINHLIHHTSGLRDQWNLLATAGWRLDDVITQKQIMRLISRQRELNFKPGEEMVYCNTGYTLMAEIVSRVSGTPFPEWCRQNIFLPLNMNNTFFYDDHERVVKHRAYSYHRASDGYKKSVLSYANAGATSLFTTVEDLALWAVNFETLTVGNKNVMDMMNERFVLTNGDTIKYAFGQVLDEYKGLRTISHGGADAGYRSFLLRVPDEKFSVVMFSNLGSFNPGSLGYQLVDAFLADKLVLKKEEPKPAAVQTSVVQEVREKPFDPSSIKLADYAGTYVSDELQTFYTFSVKNDTLWAYHQRHDDIKFIPEKYDEFSASAWFIGNVAFVRDAKNKVVGLKMSSGRVRNLAFRKQ